MQRFTFHAGTDIIVDPPAWFVADQLDHGDQVLMTFADGGERTVEVDDVHEDDGGFIDSQGIQWFFDEIETLELTA